MPKGHQLFHVHEGLLPTTWRVNAWRASDSISSSMLAWPVSHRPGSVQDVKPFPAGLYSFVVFLVTLLTGFNMDMANFTIALFIVFKINNAMTAFEP